MLVNVPKQMSQMALLHFKECAPVPNYSEINAYKSKNYGLDYDILSFDLHV